MRIGILGAGMIGGTLGKLWRQAGHEVYFGTRHPEAVAKLAAQIGASTGSASQAAVFGEVVLLAVPLKSMPELAPSLAAHVRGKIVLDANNAYPERDGQSAHDATAHPGGSSAWVAELLPGARVVKAFNTVYYKVLEQKTGLARVGIPLAGDEAEALATAEKLVRDAGFAPVVAGKLSTGKRFEPGTAVYNTGIDGPTLAKTLGVGAG